MIKLKTMLKMMFLGAAAMLLTGCGGVPFVPLI